MNQAKLALKQAEVDCESSHKCRNDIDKLQEEVGLITLNMTQAVTDCRNSSDRKWVKNFEDGVSSWISALELIKKANTDCKVPATFSSCEEDMSKAANHIHYAYQIISDAITNHTLPNFHFLLKNIKEAQVALK